jgi:hypothetical protein
MHLHMQPLAPIREPDARALFAQLRTYPLPIFSPSPDVNPAQNRQTASAPELMPQIADGQFHPLLASGLHLLNADLHAARAVLDERDAEGGGTREREDEEKVAAWLRAILARLSGDYAAAEAGYERVAAPSEVSLQLTPPRLSPRASIRA